MIAAMSKSNASHALRAKVESEAIRLGASMCAIYKWRNRGIPAAWQLKLLQGKAISQRDIKRLAIAKNNFRTAAE